jgi:hypothetical protein
MSNLSTTTLPVRMGTIIAALITTLCVGCGGGGGGGDSGSTASAGTGSTPTTTTPTTPTTTTSTPPASSPPIATATTTTGWTTFTASSNTRIIYVSKAGNDSNDGLSTATPKLTLAAGQALMRNGYPDWLLLRKGDIWTNEIFSGCLRSGQSSTQPALISSYGTGARPLIKVRHNQGAAIETNLGGGCVGTGNNIAIVGLEFYAYDRDPSNAAYSVSNTLTDVYGMHWLNPFTYLLIEDVKMSFFSLNLSAEGTQNGSKSSNLIIRRSIFTDAYSASGHSQGVFIDGTNSVLVEDSFFDHNGWNASVPGATATIFNHNIYMQTTCGPSIVRNSIFANGSATGLQQRGGGTIYDNFFVRNPTAFYADAVPSTMTYNVVTEGNDIGSGNLQRGMGILLNDGNGPTGTNNSVIQNNIVANTASGNSGFALQLCSVNDPCRLKGVNMTNNIVYNWGGGIVLSNATGNTTSPNEVNQSGYPSPSRSVGSYFGTLGGTPTLNAFLAAARTQSKDSWNTNLTAHSVNTYIRAGFGR